MTDTLALRSITTRSRCFPRPLSSSAEDPDPLKNQYVRDPRQAGTVAWRSVLQYGSGDVMYRAGIRRCAPELLASSCSE
jgi:hypothetical protein